jgi:hypothetical protein
MDALRRTSRTARASSLLSLAALAVHELRYLLTYGDRAGEALANQGHAYLSDLGGAVVTLTMATLLAALFAGALAPPACRPDRPAGCPPARSVGGHTPVRTGLLYALALLAIFCAQELAEGAVAAGHPAGPAAVLGHGGWLALPLALVAGALCSLACLALQGVEQTLARRPPRCAPRQPPVLAAPHAAPARRSLASLSLAFGFARRPPPLLSAG